MFKSDYFKNTLDTQKKFEEYFKIMQSFLPLQTSRMSEKYSSCFLEGPEHSEFLLVIGSRSWHRTIIKALAFVGTANRSSLVAVVVALGFFL